MSAKRFPDTPINFGALLRIMPGFRHKNKVRRILWILYLRIK
jgi:hypothetical protein